MKDVRKSRSNMICFEKILTKPKDKVRSIRNYITKIEHGNEGRGYSIKNIIESYYERKITGLAS